MEGLKRPLGEGVIALSLGIIVLLPFVLYGIFFAAHPKQKSENNSLVSPTPVPLILNKQYVSPDTTYTVHYPSSWTLVTYPGDAVTNFVFTQDGQQYAFVVSPPGQTNPENLDPKTTTSETTDVIIGSQTFTQTLWKNNGQPFFITAFPTNNEKGSFFSMQLPPSNTEYYLNLFNKILSTTQFKAQ